MSNRTHVRIIGVALAAMTLAAMTAVAHAQPTDEQAARRPATQGQVGEPWRHQTSVPGRPAEPGGQPGWRLASLGFLAAALALAGGLAVNAATRPGRSTRVGQST
jgi:hypothetical protein